MTTDIRILGHTDHKGTCYTVGASETRLYLFRNPVGTEALTTQQAKVWTPLTHPFCGIESVRDEDWQDLFMRADEHGWDDFNALYYVHVTLLTAKIMLAAGVE